MLDPQIEISKLKNTLAYAEVPRWKIDKIADQANKDIGDQVINIVANALQETVSHGANIGAEEFVKQLTVTQSGPSFKIMTTSGKMDFTEPPFPMLPKLLRNAKVAKDGSLYKVIPVGKSGNKQTLDIFDAMSKINEASRAAKEENADKNVKSQDVRSKVVTFSGMASIENIGKKTIHAESSSGKPEFRTASSKQNPNEKWVKPEKKLDMTGYLMDINTRVEKQVDEVIISVIRAYEEQYLWHM